MSCAQCALVDRCFVCSRNGVLSGLRSGTPGTRVPRMCETVGNSACETKTSMPFVRSALNVRTRPSLGHWESTPIQPVRSSRGYSTARARRRLA